ncbi:uncharacterized protein C8A04DRAFT_29878 [Dichotomopilus funicola]|uniref:Uncharacterized protein n=1 Tax=Dichotomopilus funicola TaxID=1934379 RepID=A0AAN6ZKA9_9PEZI|nr:hypothetical protein C8A04DRAFT_29878 [Dichotomopilus funicola]
MQLTALTLLAGAVASVSAAVLAPKNNSTLFINDCALFLYGGEGHSHQKLGVHLNREDRDNLEYFDETRNWPGETGLTRDWTVDWESKSVEFLNMGYLACPTLDGTYTMGLTHKDSLPGTSPGCIVFSVQAFRDDTLVGCDYSEVVNPDDFLKI